MFDVFISQGKILQELGGTVSVVLLVFSRCIAFTSTAPFIGSKQIPTLAKISFAMVLTLLIVPVIEVPSEYPRNYKFIYLIIMNVMVGLLIGWVATLVTELARVAGEMLNMQMALNAATIFDPSAQTQTAIVGHLFNSLAMIIFITVGGMEKAIEAVLKSFQTFPVLIYEFTFNFDKLLKATADVFFIGYLIVSPIIVVILVMDLILGLMSRAAPQINAFQISFSIKPTIGLVLFLILLPAMMEILVKIFSDPTRFFY